MPRKIRELIDDLKRAGFAERGAKRGHRVYKHPDGRLVSISGDPGDDARAYQERQVRRAIEEANS